MSGGRRYVRRTRRSRSTPRRSRARGMAGRCLMGQSSGTWWWRTDSSREYEVVGEEAVGAGEVGDEVFAAGEAVALVGDEHVFDRGVGAGGGGTDEDKSQN